MSDHPFFYVLCLLKYLFLLKLQLTIMKKITLLLTASFIALSAMAQTTAPVATATKPFSFGIKGGINLSSIIGDDADFKPATGFTGGMFFNYMIGKKGWNIHTEAVYSMLGAKIKGTKNDEIRLDYIQIPVVAKYAFTKVPVSIHLGPQIGFLTSAKTEIDGITTKQKDVFNTVDFSAVAGAAYQFPKSKMGVGARYQYSLSKLGKEGNAKLYNSVASLSLTYKF